MRPLLLATLLVAASLALGGCGSSLPQSPDFEVVKGGEDEVVAAGPAGEGSSADGDGDADGADRAGPSQPTGGPTAPTTPAPPEVYAGALATTARVAFSDVDTCSYEVWMKDVEVAVTIAGGKLTAVDVASQMNETADAGCAYATIKPNTHAFKLAKELDAAPLEAGKSLPVAMIGASAAAPKTTLSVSLSMLTTGITASLTWRRVDNVSDGLKWTVNTKVVAKPAP